MTTDRPPAVARVRRAVRPLADRLVGPLDVPRRFRPCFRDIRPGDVAIDCGAHVGRITAVLAARGAEVHAFEPNPHAFAVLRDRFTANPRVHCHEAAVAVEAGRARLHLHRDTDADPVGRATGSSLLVDKGNVSDDRFVEVEAVDLVAFVESLARPVALLKLDVEGLEPPLLTALAQAGALTEIRHVLVEMHDRLATGGHTPEGTAVRALLAQPQFAHVRLDWD